MRNSLSRIIFLSFLMAVPATVPAQAQNSRIVQLTHEGITHSLSDPAIEYEPNGVIHIYGTSNGTYLEYPSENDFLSGANAIEKHFIFTHPDGTPFTPDETPWDLNHLQWQVNGKIEDVYYAGAMTPPAGHETAVWPFDNFSRRSHAFVESVMAPGTLIELPGQVFSDHPVDPELENRFPQAEWIGHNYGRDFVKAANGNVIRDSDGSVTVVYERIGRLSANGKMITEIAGRKMSDPFVAQNSEIPLLGIDENKPYPAVVREDGDLLMEGPRVTQVEIGSEKVFIMAFSSSDFPTNHYGINLATSVNALGPYTPRLNANGTDLEDFASIIRDRYNLSWGPGRPNFFQDTHHQWWMAFVAVKRAEHPNQNYSVWPADLEQFFVNLFIVPVQFHFDQAHQLQFDILDQELKNSRTSCFL